VIRYILLLVLLFPCVLPSYTQSHVDLWLHHIGKQEGLPGEVQEVFQDSEGFVWLGTVSGLIRYDGQSMIHYQARPEDSTSLSGNQVHGKILEDKNKNLWFCTNTGIQCYHRKSGRFSSYHAEDSRKLKIQSGYQSIYLERDSFLWIKANGRSLYYFDIHSKKQPVYVGSTAFDIDIFPGIDDDERLRYLFSVDGSKSPGLEVFEFDHSKSLVRQYTTFDGITAHKLEVHSIVYEHPDTLWLSCQSGLYLWSLESSTIKDFRKGASNPRFITPANNGIYLLNEMMGGLYYWGNSNDPLKKLEYRLLNAPASESAAQNAYKPYWDKSGNIWLSVSEGGLLFGHPEKSKFNAIPKYTGFDDEFNYQFRTMAQSANGDIWCSTFHDGLFLLDANGQLKRHYHPDHPTLNALSTRQINHLLVSSRGTLWLATQAGVYQYIPGQDRFFSIKNPSGTALKDAAYLLELKDGSLLVSTILNGLYQIYRKGNSYEAKNIYASPAGPGYFTTLYKDSLGSVYASSTMAEIQIFSFSGQQLQPLITKDIKGFINGFYEDENGKTLWIATSFGLVKLDKTDLKQESFTYTTAHGLPSNEVNSLVPGNDGRLWMGTGNGIAAFDRRTEKVTNFQLADGTQSFQFEQLSALRHKNGTIWMGGNNGITIIDPSSISTISQNPDIQITEILVNDLQDSSLADALTGYTNPTLIQSIKKNHKDNTLSFSFVGIDYSEPSAVQLAYKMEGVDDDWVYLEKGENGFARYAALSPNKYAFKIRATNSDGIWSDNIRTLSIHITPPWYQTWWAISLFFLLFSLLVYGIYRYRIMQIRKEEAFKRKELEYKRSMAETETAILRLQMNPHFIFNSMNSISSYIINKDINTANDYLNRFASLMRMILKLASKPFLAIAEEMELLERYIQTESMRLDDKINYEFDLAAEIDPDEYILPTMILQPFVENAIWHGLAHKKGYKKITIAIRLEEEQLICTVEDNGVGRQAAAHSRQSVKKHQSKAINITRKRLKHLEEMEEGQTSLEIIDLKDDRGDPRGTRVCIKLPVL